MVRPISRTPTITIQAAMTAQCHRAQVRPTNCRNLCISRFSWSDKGGPLNKDPRSGQKIHASAVILLKDPKARCEHLLDTGLEKIGRSVLWGGCSVSCRVD